MKSKTYEEFVDKFKPKLTTDDCYTPEPVYEAVVKYCEERYHITRDQIIRPFYPGGDYEAEDYTGRVVVDNPPFSILAKIVRFYAARQIPFFLFAPTLTLFESRLQTVTYIALDSKIVYHNGAVVNTSFITNMEPGIQCRSDPYLYRKITNVVKEYRAMSVKELPKYEMPDAVLTATKLAYFSKYGVEYQALASRSRFIRSIRSMREAGKAIFGGGFLLSERAAAERAAAERAAAERAAAERAAAERAAAERAAAERAAAQRWELSDEEKEQSAALDK